MKWELIKLFPEIIIPRRYTLYIYIYIYITTIIV